MQESPFIQLLLQRGYEIGYQIGMTQSIAQSLREHCIKNILSVLTARFSKWDVDHVEQLLKSIHSLDRLMELQFTAVKIPSVETFLQELYACYV